MFSSRSHLGSFEIGILDMDLIGVFFKSLCKSKVFLFKFVRNDNENR